MRTRLRLNERIYRYEVPVDDQWHEIRTMGDPLHVCARDPRVVEFWARYTPGAPHGVLRRFLVVGTGQPMPEDVMYHGTAVAGPLVWHLVGQP